ncbi:hypothetical protein ABW21_db0207538 [Orbilia brochopaga]|nr:hypothetical protein ABW21_db0207538 [Drechslerella brochopaga]
MSTVGVSSADSAPGQQGGKVYGVVFLYDSNGDDDNRHRQTQVYVVELIKETTVCDGQRDGMERRLVLDGVLGGGYGEKRKKGGSRSGSGSNWMARGSVRAARRQLDERANFGRGREKAIGKRKNWVVEIKKTTALQQRS